MLMKENKPLCHKNDDILLTIVEKCVVGSYEQLMHHSKHPINPDQYPTRFSTYCSKLECFC